MNTIEAEGETRLDTVPGAETGIVQIEPLNVELPSRVQIRRERATERVLQQTQSTLKNFFKSASTQGITNPNTVHDGDSSLAVRDSNYIPGQSGQAKQNNTPSKKRTSTYELTPKVAKLKYPYSDVQGNQKGAKDRTKRDRLDEVEPERRNGKSIRSVTQPHYPPISELPDNNTY